MVTALQCAGGALSVNVHFHTLVPDGVFTEDPEGTLVFHPVPGPSAADVAAALATTSGGEGPGVGPPREGA